MSDKIIAIAAIFATILLGVFGIILREHVAVAQFVAVCLASLLALLLLWWYGRRIENTLANAERKVEATKGEVGAVRTALKSLSGELHLGSSEQMAWTTFGVLVGQLREKIASDSEFSPDIVVSVGRSGATVGSILAGNLGPLPHLGIDRINSWSREKTALKRDVEIVPDVSVLSSFLMDKSVLCVMSECDTGFTLEAATKELEDLPGIGTVRTAVLFRAASTHFVPDYFVEQDSGARPRFPFKSSEWLSSSSKGPLGDLRVVRTK